MDESQKTLMAFEIETECANAIKEIDRRYRKPLDEASAPGVRDARGYLMLIRLREQQIKDARIRRDIAMCLLDNQEDRPGVPDGGEYGVSAAWRAAPAAVRLLVISKYLEEMRDAEEGEV